MKRYAKRGGWLSVEDIGRSIDEVLELARTQVIELALAGGAAMQIWGSDRFTKDVDFLANRVPDGLEEIQPIGFGGMQLRASNGVPVDIIVRNDELRTLYEYALSHAVDVEDVPVRVVSPNFLVAIKLAAHRDKDLLDLKYLLTECQDVDYPVARGIVLDLLGIFAAQELDRYREDFLVSLEREERKNPSRRRH